VIFEKHSFPAHRGLLGPIGLRKPYREAAVPGRKRSSRQGVGGWGKETRL